MDNRIFVRLRLSTLLVVLLAIPAAADDWPQWRGPNRSGVSAETGLSDKWPEDGPPVSWEVDSLGNGYGTVSVVGDRIYVQGTRGRYSVVMALDATNGATVWTTALGTLREQDKGRGPRSTPTVVGDEIYVLNERGELARLQGGDGSIVWQLSMTERFGVSNIRWSISESPLVEGDRVFVMPGGRRGAIAAVERATGDTVWRSTGLTDAMSYSSLVAADIAGIRTIVGLSARAGVGVRADDGTLLWRYKAPANRTANVATPVVGGDRVFYTSSYGVGGGAVEITESGSGVEAHESYFRSNLQNHHGGVVLLDGYLYGMFGRALTCVDFETGEIVWRSRSVGKGSLTAADGKLFLLGENHEVGLAAASGRATGSSGDSSSPSWAGAVGRTRS